jgi:hypothetical protein
MIGWRPQPAWFAANCPKIFAAGQATKALPKLAAWRARNFSD